MKAILLCLLSATAATHAPAQGYGAKFLTEDERPPVAANHDDAKLVAMRKAANSGGIKKAGKANGWDLAENSEYIVFSGFHTLLPKNSIIHIPESQQARVASRPSGKFVPWREFATKYRGVVTTFEVTFDQASGKEPLPAARLKPLLESDLIVVAVLGGSPISCHATATEAR